MSKDLTQGSPMRLIISFSIPLILGNIFQQLYSMADTIIVGRTIGVEALAAVGATSSLVFFIIGFAQGMTSGFAVITSQRFGAKDSVGVRKSFLISALLSFIITILLTIFGLLILKPMLILMQTPEDILTQAISYVKVLYIGAFTTIIFNLLSNTIRALGDSKTPLIFLVIASILNIGLDLFLILVMKMGIAGAAWATIVSQFISGILCLILMIFKYPQLKPLPRDLGSINFDFVMLHLKMGLPMALQFTFITFGFMVVQVALNRLGTNAIAAFTAANKIDNISIQVLASFGIAIATYVAQNYGARNLERITQGLRSAIKISLTTSVLMGATVIFCGKWIISIFVGSNHPEVIDFANTYILTNCSMYFILSLLFIYRNALQGLGKSLVPTITSFVELGMRIFAAFILSIPLGFAGVALSNPIAWIGAVIPLISAYYININRLLRVNER